MSTALTGPFVLQPTLGVGENDPGAAPAAGTARPDTTIAAATTTASLLNLNIARPPRTSPKMPVAARHGSDHPIPECRSGYRSYCSRGQELGVPLPGPGQRPDRSSRGD